MLVAITATLCLSACAGTAMHSSPENVCGGFGKAWNSPRLASPSPANADKFNVPMISFNVGSAHEPGPRYPNEAMECEEPGAATIQFQVSEDGRGTSFEIVEWQGSQMFAQAALTYLEQPGIRFHPAPEHVYAAGNPYRFHINFNVAAPPPQSRS